MVRQERAVRTREALIRSAAEIFDRDGFTVASLSTISSQAGVSNGALHFHFSSKAALAAAVEAAAAQRLCGITERGQRERTRNLQMLVDVTHAFVRGLREDVVLRAGFELSGDAARTAETCLRRCWHDWVEGILKRADSEGELRPAVVPKAAVTTVVAATVGFEVLATQDAGWLSRSTVTQFWQLLLPNLAAPEILGELLAEGSGGTP